jgi:hypothetical protein
LKIITRNVGFIDKYKVKKRKRRTFLLDKNNLKAIVFMYTVFLDEYEHLENLIGKPQKKKSRPKSIDSQYYIKNPDGLSG